jgi:Na+/melibiose symporter-like transporter
MQWCRTGASLGPLAGTSGAQAERNSALAVSHFIYLACMPATVHREAAGGTLYCAAVYCIVTVSMLMMCWKCFHSNVSSYKLRCRYDFTDGDLNVSLAQLQEYLDSYESPPFR